MCLTLPAEKVAKFKAYVGKYLECSYITKKELECLNGLLAHCSQIVQGGRIFTRRCFNMYQVAISKGLSRLKISDGMICDLCWWSDFAPYFNGESLIPYEHHPYIIWTDASQKGFGASFGCDWLAGDWAGALEDNNADSDCTHFTKPPVLDSDQATNINVLELYAVVMAVERWSHLLTNYFVTLKSDNMQVVYMLSNHASINSQCMDWLRRLFWTTMRYNIRILPSYVPTDENVLADALSRLLYFKDVGKFHAILEKFN